VSGLDALSSFLDMGGRAAFVWPAYGVTLVVLVGMLLLTIHRMRARRGELERLEGSRRRSGGPKLFTS
jgi:heme exporter protein D